MNSEVTTFPELDLAVIGAGFCGSVLALRADEMGLRVRVFDTQDRYPDHFRAEKLETDQYDALTALGLVGLVRPKDSPQIDRVYSFRGNAESMNRHAKHRGIHYADTVNAFRDVLRERQLLAVRKIAAIRDGNVSSEVEFDDGSRIAASIVALTTGMGAGLRKSLRLEPGEQEKLVSTTFGFDIEPQSATGPAFTAFNIKPDRFSKGLQYVTFFPVGERMRANLFTCWDPHSDAAKQLKADPLGEIARLFPGHAGRIGSLEMSSDLQAYTTRYYRMNVQHLARTVLMGDAFQSVSPATGMGLSKCLVDVQVLAGLLPRLLEDSRALVPLDEYYRDERKTQTDDEALQRWRWENEASTSRSLVTQLKKLRLYASAAIRSKAG